MVVQNSNTQPLGSLNRATVNTGQVARLVRSSFHIVHLGARGAQAKIGDIIILVNI